MNNLLLMFCRTFIFYRWSLKMFWIKRAKKGQRLRNTEGKTEKVHQHGGPEVTKPIYSDCPSWSQRPCHRMTDGPWWDAPSSSATPSLTAPLRLCACARTLARSATNRHPPLLFSITLTPQPFVSQQWLCVGLHGEGWCFFPQKITNADRRTGAEMALQSPAVTFLHSIFRGGEWGGMELHQLKV